MTISVAVALVVHEGCYLVGRRGPDGPLAGYDEFPGGKCRPGELPADCAVRECWEETGLRVEVLRLRQDIEHTYPYARVHLYFFDCRVTTGTDPSGAHYDFTWVPRRKLIECRFPEPNHAVLAELLNERDPSSHEPRRSPTP